VHDTGWDDGVCWHVTEQAKQAREPQDPGIGTFRIKILGRDRLLLTVILTRQVQVAPQPGLGIFVAWERRFDQIELGLNVRGIDEVLPQKLREIIPRILFGKSEVEVLRIDLSDM
jgi:hypothetical protein